MHLRPTLSTVVILGLAASAFACVDVTPITDVPSRVDAGVDVALSASTTDSACFQCASGAVETGPSCTSEYEACRADPKCLSLFACGIPKGCYGGVQDLVGCFTACGVAAGITGFDDPAVAPFMALYRCAASSCTAACTVVATEPAEAGAVESSCAPPEGETCPPKTGNCNGIGARCTKGGGECGGDTTCDVDADPHGVGICVTVLCSAGSCGAGATCCRTPTTQDFPICLPNQCLPADCTADP